jgi:hypothetical protein
MRFTEYLTESIAKERETELEKAISHMNKEMAEIDKASSKMNRLLRSKKHSKEDYLKAKDYYYDLLTSSEKTPEHKQSHKVLSKFQNFCSDLESWVEGQTERKDAKKILDGINLYYPIRNSIIKTGKAYKIWNWIDGYRMGESEIEQIVRGKKKIKIKSRMSSYSFSLNAVKEIRNRYEIENAIITSINVTPKNCIAYIPKLLVELDKFRRMMPDDYKFKFNKTMLDNIEREDEVLVMMEAGDKLKIESIEYIGGSWDLKSLRKEILKHSETEY